MSSRARWSLLLAALIGATLWSYRPALDAEFIRFDDSAYIQTNPPVATGLRLENVRWALTGYQSSNWHPITWISHMIDVEVFGLEPRGHHTVNVALHLLNVALLFVVLRRLTNDAAPSLFVAALFALHPANVESVAWIAQRKTLLSTLFALLSIGSYASHARGGGRSRYVVSVLCLALSLMSKGMFVTLPFGLLLLDYWPLRRAAFETAAGRAITPAALLRGWWRLLPEKIPFALLSVAASIITLDAQRDSMSTVENYSIAARLGNVALSYVEYVHTLFAPFHLAVFYPLDPERLTPRLVLTCIAILVVMTIAFVWLGLRRRYLLVGWLWFLGTLVPVIGLVQVGMQSMADRYVYVPFWGLGIALAWSAQDLLRWRPSATALRAVVVVAAVLPLAGLALLTHRQSAKWHDEIGLFEATLANTENNWLAHGALAERYFARSDFPKTIEHCQEAAKYNRDMGTVRSTWGLALYETGFPDLALEQFELAVTQDPDNPVGFMNLGWIYTERGLYDLALARLANAARLTDRATPAATRKTIFANWASALAKTRRLQEAREKFALALEIEPDEAALLRDAARVDLRLRDPDAAIERLRRVLAADPADADAAYLLASALELQGNAAEAANGFARALAANPRQAVVTIDLARTLAGEDRRDEAIQLLDALLAQPPPAHEADARFVTSTVLSHRGEIALEHGDVAGAIAALDRAVAAWPDNYDANTRLAFLLATAADPALRNPPRAIDVATRASGQRREYGSLATLAVAYAAAGNPAAAVDTAREALALATQTGDRAAVAALEQQLELYTQAQRRISDAPK
jgi:protein O-mannosyl-transferase